MILISGNRINPLFLQVLLALGLLLMLAGCGGGGTAGLSGQSGVPAELQSVADQLPALPFDAAGSRSGSAIIAGSKTGSQAAQRSLNTSIQGADLLLTSGPLSMEWAYYQFAVGTAPVLDMACTFSLQQGSTVYIGVSNYGKNRWEFNGPYTSNTLVTLPTGTYASGGGNAYVLFVVFNNTTTLLQSVNIHYDTGTTYHIAGHVRDGASAYIPGSMVTLQPGNQQVSVNLDGTYVFSGLNPGSYNVTPSAANFTFNPATLPITITDADVDTADFTGTAQAPTYSINGTILDNLAAPIAGSSVLVTPGNLTFNCDGQGNYSATGLEAGTYKVTPQATNYTFVPAFSNIDVTDADVNNINFTGTSSTPAVTYVDDARPFFATNCAGCHGTSDPSAGKSWLLYDTAAANLTAIKNAVNNDHMGSYSGTDKTMISNWVDGGGTLGASATHWSAVSSAVFGSCTSCHATTLSGGARNGAPLDVNFNTYAAAISYRSNGKLVCDRANVRVQAGTMPPGGPLGASAKQLLQDWTNSGWPN